MMIFIGLIVFIAVITVALLLFKWTMGATRYRTIHLVVLLASSSIGFWGLLSPTPAYAQDPVEVDIQKLFSDGSTERNFDSGKAITFMLPYACRAINLGEQCENVVITDTLPIGLDFLGVEGLPSSATSTFNVVSNEVVIDFGTIPDGDTGIVRIMARFPPGASPSTPDTINRVIIDADNSALKTSNAVTATINPGEFEMTASKSVANDFDDLVIGNAFETDYTISICSPDEIGGLNLTNPEIVDQLPAEATYLRSTPAGVYNSGNHTVSWTYTSNGGTLPNVIPVGGCYTIDVILQYATNGPDNIPGNSDDPMAPNLVTNTAITITGTPEASLPVNIGPVGVTSTLRTPYYAHTFTKNADSPSSYTNNGIRELPNNPVNYTFSLLNTGTLTITDVVITDTINTDLILQYITISPGFTTTVPATGTYRINQGPLLPLPGGPFVTATTILSSSLGLGPGDRVTEVQWHLGDIPFKTPPWQGGFGAIISATASITETIPNCAHVSFTYTNTVTTDCASVEVITPRAIPRVEKTASGNSYLPEETFDYILQVRNDSVAHLPVDAPLALADLLSEKLEIVVPDFTEPTRYRPATNADDWFSFTTTDGIAITPTATITPNYVGDQALALWLWSTPGYTLAPGEMLEITFQARAKKGTFPTTIDNEAALLWNPTTTNPLACDGSDGNRVYTDTLDLNNNGLTTEIGCVTSPDKIKIEAFLKMESQKYVYGEKDSFWNSDGLTVPTGDISYMAIITNQSNITATNLVLYDIFPYVGDEGVTKDTERLSDWRPNLQMPITVSQGISATIYYSRSTNPCRPDVYKDGPPGCIDDWSTTPPAQLTEVDAIKIEFCDMPGQSCLELPPNDGFSAGGSIAISWLMSAPNGATYEPDRAWNSFGYTAQGGGLTLLPAEPNKVGIRITGTTGITLGDYVWFDVYGQQHDGIQQPEEFGINGARVELYDNLGNPVDADGDGDDDFRITGPDASGKAGYYLFNDLTPGDTYRVRFYLPTTYTIVLTDGMGHPVYIDYPGTYTATLSNATANLTDTLDSDGTTYGTDPTHGLYIETDLISTNILTPTDLTWDQGFWLPTDYGDAPAALGYPTRAISETNPADAARHVIVPGLYMGSQVDGELDGPIDDGDAFGDDVDDGNDDEDGVTFEYNVGTPAQPSGVFYIGQSTSIDVATTVPGGQTAYLNAWIDYNGDGDWDDTGEQIANDRSTTGGNVTLNFTVPGTVISGTSYARFRLSTEADLGPTGTAHDGEVEDYHVQFIGLPVKSLVATSEAHTGFLNSRENLAIGEIARFRLQAQLPEGTAYLYQLRDLLSGDLQFLNDNTATVAFVSSGGSGITSTTISGGAGLYHTGNESNVNTITPTYLLGDLDISANANYSNNNDSYGSGTDAYFRLGTLTNADRDLDHEYVIIEFNALLVNDTNSNRTDQPHNRVQTLIDINDDGTSEAGSPESNQILLRVVEPDLSLSKTLNTISVDAGDTISYTLQFTNTASGGGAATAFDLILTDTLDSNLTLVGLPQISAPGGLIITDTTSAPNVTVAVNRLNPGQSVSLVITATVSPVVPAGQHIPNTAYVDYTSLPGPNGTITNTTGSITPGTPGDPNGERDGSDGSAPNDYTTNAQASFITRAAIPAKLIDSTSAAHTLGTNVTIGEVITYSLIVAIPEGVVPQLTITDTLPAGLAYYGQYGINDSNFAGSFTSGDPTVNPAGIGGNGQPVLIQYLNPITNPANNDASDNIITITLQTVVTDVVSNVGLSGSQTDLVNQVTIQTGSSEPRTSPPITVTVVEPSPLITKTISPSSAAFGDTITVTLEVENVGLSTAFEVMVDDPLPNATFINITDLGSPGFTFSTIPSGPETIVRYSNGTLAPGASAMMTFTAQITGYLPNGLVHTNVATVTQATTLPGSNPNERDEPDLPDADTLTFISLSLGNLVWYDANNNGLVDGGENGLPNVVLELLDGTGTAVINPITSLPYTTTTDLSGHYTFTSLISGTYQVLITSTNFAPGKPLADFISSTPTQANTDNNVNNDDNGLDDPAPVSNGIWSNPVNLSVGDEPINDGDTDPQSNLTVDFGFFEPLRLGNRVWYDVDNNGLLDGGENGVPNVIVNLLNSSGNPVTDTVTSLPITTTTNASGFYTFTHLISGTYQVEIDAVSFQPGQPLANYLSSTPTDANADNSDDSDDNGLDDLDPAINGIRSGNVVLKPNNEPTSESDETGNWPNPDSNLTVDFGFAQFDWGDLPDPIYNTDRSGTVGPSHLISPTLYLGNQVDAETNGQPNATATGDDAADSNDDEDGIALPATLAAGQTALFTATVVNTHSTTVIVDGFVDWNGDGLFTGPEEVVMQSTSSSGPVVLSFFVPVTATTGTPLGARFRLSTTGIASADGPAPNGEVEDYLVTVTSYDLGDAPLSYSTTLANSGARHPIVTGLHLGATVDAEGDGQPTTGANGDDSDSQGDDEDGLQFSDLIVGHTATITVTASTTGTLDAWLDFNADGSWAESIDPIFSGQNLNPGSTVLTFTVPLTAAITTETYSRFRYSSAGVATYTGDALDGEVEDYAHPIISRDYGDLPNGYATTLANNGAFHTLDGLTFLGAGVDSDPDGAPNNTATGDDAADSNDDEDGITFLTPLMPGQSADIQIIAGSAGYLNAWIDFDGDGLLEAGEQIFTEQHYASAGSYTESITVPTTISQTLYSRFRYTANAGEAITPDGPAPSGEVEDYVLMSLGDTVWLDSAPSPLFNDGLLNGGELGLAGVTLTLVYSGTSTPLATTTTDSTGNYLFTGLMPGDYQVIVAPANFQPGASLDTYVSSSNVNDPETNVDDDDNGLDPSSYADHQANGVTSLPINLSLGNEPHNGGNANLTLDFGFYPSTLSLGNLVWFDHNNNGQVDSGESGVAGVTVVLLQSNTPIMTTTTDSLGHYRFNGLLPNAYQVQLGPSNFQAGGPLFNYYSSTSNGLVDNDVDNNDDGLDLTSLLDYPNQGIRSDLITLAFDSETLGNEDGDGNSNSNLTVDFGFFQPVSVGDFVWHDLNANGIQDIGENGIAGVTVTLILSGTGQITTTLTDASGYYTFTQASNGLPLLQGEYAIEVTPPPGYVVSPAQQGHDATDSDIDPITLTSPFIFVPSSTHNPTFDAGLYLPVSIGDLVWFDVDADGEQDSGEVGIGGITVTLTLSGTGVVSITKTNTNGLYLFTHNSTGHPLPAGTYVVTFEPSESYTLSPVNQAGGDDAADSDAHPTTGSSDPITLVSGDHIRTVDAGLYLLTGLGNYIWHDADQDGIQDAGEAGLPNIAVSLILSGTGVVSTTTTDSGGFYQFLNLDPGDYFVAVTVPTGYAVSPPDQGSDNAVDSDIDPTTGQTAITTLAPGEYDPTWDGGLFQIQAALSIEKTVSVARIAPNQVPVLTYTLTVTNSGNLPLTTVNLTDTLDLGLNYLPNSATIAPSSINAQTLVWQDVTAGQPLQPGQATQLTFEATVTTTIGTYLNLAMAQATYAAGFNYPGGATNLVTDTVPVEVADPAVSLIKRITAPGAVDGIITFTIDITNTGPSPLEVLPLFDTFSGPLAYLGGTPRADVISNTDQLIAWHDLTTHFGNIAPGQTISIETVFEITANTSDISISNQARTSGVTDVFANAANPAQDMVQVVNIPTAVSLLSFKAAWVNEQMRLTWQTAWEQDNFGFKVRRSTSGNLADATEIAFVPGQGFGTQEGVSYTFIDETALRNQAYTYWLIDVDLAGLETVHGPVSTEILTDHNGDRQIYLPLVRR